MINENTLNFIRFSSGFNNLKKEELEAFAENEIFELNEYNASDEKQRKHFYTLLQSTDGTQGVKQEDGKYTHTAWAYSSDGTNGFTTVYPKLNLLKGTRNLTATSTTTVWDTLFNSSQIYDSAIKSKTGVSAMNFSFNVYIPLNAMVGSSLGIQLKGQNSKAGNVGSDEWNTITAWCGYVIKQSDLGKTIRVNAPVNLDKEHTKYQSFDVALADTASITIRQSSDIPGFVYSRLKLEPGSTATSWMPSASEVTTADWPSYMGQYTDYTLEDSINPSSYTWREIEIHGKYFYTLEDVNTNGTLKSYIIECLKLSLQTRWGNNLEYHIDRKTKYLNKLTGMQA